MTSTRPTTSATRVPRPSSSSAARSPWTSPSTRARRSGTPSTTVPGRWARPAFRIVRHDSPARERPVLSSAHVDVAGRRLHAHVVAAEPREAVDLLVDRLRRQVGDAMPVGGPATTAAPAATGRGDCRRAP